jgi:hypothetical protein
MSIFFLNWIFLLALFPVAFFWLRRAWRIGVKRDFSEVALKRGELPPQVEKWAPYEMVINGLAGVVAVYVIFAVLFTGIAYENWTAIAGTTIWSKFMLTFALSRHAHGFGAKKSKV